MSQTCVGSWHIRPTPSEFEGKPGIKKTWTGPISGEIYGKGLKDLCNKTNENLTRLSLQMQKLDPCLDFGIKHWHPTTRPASAQPVIERPKTPGRWESVEVMFTDNKVLDSLSSHVSEDRDTYIDPPAKKSFCYLCSTLEEHERHLLHNRPKRPKSAKPRIEYIAPRPRQKPKPEEEEVRVRERLYKVEVFTSDKPNAGTSANVFIAIKGSLEILPRTQLTKKRGCTQLCFVRASKEVFHIKGPFLGNLQILSIEHDGKEKSHAWHLDRVEITDIKAMKTWVFKCEEWLSTFKKPLYSNRVDLQAIEKETPPTEYQIEVHTGKQKMAGTDSNIFITLMGQHGSSKKIHLVDPSSDKKLFERNSQDVFRIRIPGVGELKKIRIEHDGKGSFAGWFLDKVIITDSTHPKEKYYFTYGGWIAKDEGDGRLWREIHAKKQLPQELRSGTETQYQIMVKTGDKRFAGTDANVFIKLAGENGITPKLKLDDAKNNFERNMVDNFEVRSINVGPMKHIVIGHDNFGPGAGWYLEKVTVRRYIPKEEARERLKKIKKRLKLEKKEKKNKKQDSDSETESESEDGEKAKEKKLKKRGDRKDKKDKDGKKKPKEEKRRGRKDMYTVSSSSEETSESSDDEKETDKRSKVKVPKRPQSAMKRPSSALRKDKKEDSSFESSSDEDKEIDKMSRSSGRPQSAMRRPSSALRRDGKRDSSSETESVTRRRPSSAFSRDGDRKDRQRSLSRDNLDMKRQDSIISQRGRKDSVTTKTDRLSSRRISTSASSLRRKESKDYDDDDNLEEMKVPLYEECVFECNRWLAADEDDGLFVRELPVTTKRTFFKEKPMQ